MLYDLWIIDCYCFLVSLCGAEVYVYEISDLTIFSHWSVIFDFLSSHFERIEVFWMIFSWWSHVVTCLTWSFWSLWSMLCWDIFWLLVENRWILWFIIWCLSVARGELMWILWIIFWCFPVTCIGLRWFIWFFDLWFHERGQTSLYTKDFVRFLLYYLYG